LLFFQWSWEFSLKDRETCDIFYAKIDIISNTYKQYIFRLFV